MSTMGGDELLIRAALKDELSGPLEGIRDELRRVAGETSKAASKANLGARGFDRMASGAGRFVRAGIGAAARTAATGIGIMVGAAAAGSVKVLQLASDAAETASAFGTVFKGVSGNVGGYLDKLNQKFGITTRELQTAATSFGVFGKAAGVSKKELGGFTKDLVGAGLDLSSFYNANPEDVFLALKSGLAGEAEPLRQFGIFLSDAAMKAEAAQAGLTGELTESQKVMLRQRIIMKSLGDAEGDLERTKDGLANKTRALKGRLTELATELGDRLRPQAEKAAATLDRRLGKVMEKLPGWLDTAEERVGRLWRAFQRGGPEAGIDSLDRMTGAGGKLTDAFDEAKGIADDVAAVITGALVPALGDASTATGGLSSPLGILRGALGFAADHTTLVRVALTALVTTLTVAKVVTLGMAAATKVKAAADKIALINLKAHTVGTKTHLVVSKAARGATLLWAGAQRVLNLALRANPIGIVITVLAALVTGLIVAYKKSETFRKVVDTAVDGIAAAWRWLWNSVLAPVIRWIVNGIASIMDLFGDMLETMSHVPGFGWAKDAADKMHGAADATRGLADAIRDIPDRTVHIDIEPPSAATIAKVDAQLSRVGGGVPVGDTATQRGRGGNLANTLATHARTMAATGTRPTITNALVGGGGRGRGSGDHQNGRALDLVGKGLAKYGAAIRAEGGYAAFHGTGATRHLHAVPAGDTATTRARGLRSSSSSSGGTTLIVQPGGIKVDARGASSDVDVAAAVRQGIEDYLRDHEERS